MSKLGDYPANIPSLDTVGKCMRFEAVFKELFTNVGSKTVDGKFVTIQPKDRHMVVNVIRDRFMTLAKILAIAVSTMLTTIYKDDCRVLEVLITGAMSDTYNALFRKPLEYEINRCVNEIRDTHDVQLVSFPAGSTENAATAAYYIQNYERQTAKQFRPQDDD